MDAEKPIPNARVSAQPIYQTVRADGEQELSQPLGSLWWPGLAAGIAIASSVPAKIWTQTLLPMFIGNVLGGTVLFSLLAYGQVRQEID